MDKKQHIEGIRQVVGAKCDKHGIAKHFPERIAQGIYAADYRKQGNVASEFAKEMKSFIVQNCCVSDNDVDKIYKHIDKVAAKFCAEGE